MLVTEFIIDLSSETHSIFQALNEASLVSLFELRSWGQGCLCTTETSAALPFLSVATRGMGGHIFLFFTAQLVGIFGMHLWEGKKQPSFAR